MKITALGHSCVLLDFENDDGASTRILVDPWLSDHAVGDAMGRFPRVRFETADLAPIDAVYLTHGHGDHLDPYTLVRLWRELPEPPVLLLPATLSFLVPLLGANLPRLEVRVLMPQEPTFFGDLELLGLYDTSLIPSNEDDVMVLVVTHGSERVLIEADANLSLYDDPELRAYISFLLREPGIDSAVYLTTENELTGTLQIPGCRTLEAREAVVEQAMDELLESVHTLYEPTDDPDDLWYGEHVLRLIHGQGLTAPHELDPRWQQLLFPIRIDQRVREERAAAARAGFRHTIDRLVDGHVHTIVAGELVGREPEPALTLLDHEDQRRFVPDLPFFPELPFAPLRSDARDLASQRARIQALLDDRFLPWLHGSRSPPLIHLLAAHGGTYTVRIHFGSAPDADVQDYSLGFGARGFVPTTGHQPQESYWANDLDDFLDGRCDEFSTFCRDVFPCMEMRLWSCLAMPLLNADLMTKRMTLHFERARQGLTPGSYILPLYEQP